MISGYLSLFSAQKANGGSGWMRGRMCLFCFLYSYVNVMV